MRPFSRPQPRSGKKAPPEFEWVEIQMSVTTWAVTGSLGLIALGVWTGGMRLTDLGYKLEHMQDKDKVQVTVDDRQDRDIAELKGSIIRQGTLLEQINEIVKETNRVVSGSK